MASKKGLLITFTILSFTLVLCWLLNTMSTNASYDNTPPTLESVRILQNEIYAPGTFQIELNNIVEEGAGIQSIVIHFGSYGTDASAYFNYDLSAGKVFESLDPDNPVQPLFSTKRLIVSGTVPATITSGDYYIRSISLNAFGNCSQSYTLNYNTDHNPPSSKTYILGSSSDKSTCTVTNGSIKVYGETYDLSTSVSNPNVAGLIHDMEDGKTINIFTAYNNTTVPKAAFDAIKGTNKKIIVSVSDGIKWLFDGKDITGTTKAVNCKIDISTVQNESYGTTDKLIKTTFASNGKLPGKATIKLKSDYLSQLYKVGDTLNLYYLSGNKLTLEDSDVATMKSGADAWCSYDVTHNSTFLLSKNKLKYQKPYIKLNASSLKMQVGQSSKALQIKSKFTSDSVKKWTSSKSSVVSVDKKTGKLKAKKTGTATITVSLKSGVKAKCKIKVQKGIIKTTSLAVTDTKVTLVRGVGGAYNIKYTRKPITANDGKVTFKSSKPKIVAVSKKGQLTQLKKGTATITVKAGKQTKKIKVTVK